MRSGDFALLSPDDGRLWQGRGPFAAAAAPRSGGWSFYVTDFFGRDLHPWKIPAQGQESESAASSPSSESLAVEWTPLFCGPFAEHFLELQGIIRRGELRKGVPLVFETGRVAEAAALWEQATKRCAQLPPALRAYAWREAGDGFFGATPELLFRAHREGSRWRVRTMALAGTAPVGRGEELLCDAKELHEHGLVVEDLLRELRAFGKVERGPTEVHRLPALEHLRTDIEVVLSIDAPPGRLFQDLVRALHPTAALGAAPRGERARRWMTEVDAGVERRSFGAPFGAISPEGEMVCLVAIRQVQLQADGALRVGSGCGVVEQSRWHKEWRELELKRDSVKSLFGLGK